jgi:hypothetical protein
VQVADLDENVIETILTKSLTIVKAGAICALAFFSAGFGHTAFANDIETALSGRTAFEAGKTYRPWRQYFAADGNTVYFGDGPSSTGKWEIRGGQYCSLWPPAEDWACYDVELAPSSTPFLSIIWVARDGSKTVGDLFDGDLTAQRAPPNR